MNGNTYETGRWVYQGANSGSSTALMTATTVYNGSASNSSLSSPLNEVDVTTSFNNGSQSLTKNSFDNFGNLTNSAVYNGSTLLQNTANTFNQISEPVSTLTTDGANNSIFSVSYGYDETGPSATSNIPQHVAVSGGTRGNLTSTHVQASSSNTLTTTTAYYDTGVPQSNTDAGGFTTEYAYDSTQTFATSTTLPTPSSGVGVGTSATYDNASGVLTSITGMNSGQTFTATQYDLLLRLNVFSTPEGGQVSGSYTPNQISAHIQMSSSQTTDQETFFDGYGRTQRVAVASSSSWYLTDSCYDADGLLQYQSIPYVSSTQNPSGNNCASSTSTQYSYNALGRKTMIAQPDGSSVNLTYSNRATLATQANASTSISRIEQHDLLGRLSSVCELSNNSAMPGSGSPTNCGTDISGTGFLTTYAYTPSTHTVVVSQGQQQRTFQADAVGRPIYTSEPESGAASYSYAYNPTGLVVTRTRPQANQTNASVLTTTTTQYDSLGRVVNVSYNDSLTTNKGYLYDKAYSGDLIKNKGSVIGQMSNAYTQTPGGNLLYAREMVYDIMGRISETKDCLPTLCGQAAYDLYRWFTYNQASQMSNETYAAQGNGGSPVTLVYQYNTAGQLTSITGGQGNTVNGFALYSTNTSTMLPAGPSLTQVGNGLFSSYSHDSLGRVSGFSLCSGSSQPGCSGGAPVYQFSVVASGNEVTQSNDTVTGTTRNYGYDEFGRLSSLTSAANTGPAIGMTFTYDRWGNRWQQTLTGSGSQSQPQPSFNTGTNQVVQFQYDAVGILHPTE